MSDTQNAPSLKQPAGLWVLFITEMWERFSYYGMRALLVLYLIASTSEYLDKNGELVPNLNPGFGWSEENAYYLYGLYTWAVYLTPIFGGWMADKFIGTHRSMLIGGWIIAAGHITLGLSELFGTSAGEAVTLQSGPGSFLTFMLGLLLIIIGTGFFKPCVSVMVGQLYTRDDTRRDSGFTIFYMGINLGAFMSPLIAGYLGEKVGWHWGFGSAAVGMIAGMICYQRLRPRYLEGIGLSPKQTRVANDAKAFVPSERCVGCEHDFGHEGLEICPECSIQRVSASEYEQKRKLSVVDIQRLIVILILAFVGNIFFWSAFEQAGSSMNVFALKQTDLTVWGLVKSGFPASWYQSVNSLVIILFAPLFSILWIRLDKKRKNPSSPLKFCIGLWLLGLAFLAMVFGAMDASAAADGKAGPHWLLITYVVVTWGELCLSPVGLSLVTKLAPVRFQSLMMGVWFFSFSLANLFAGILAAFSTKFVPGENGEPAQWTFLIDGLAGFYLLLVVCPIVVGLLLACFLKPLKKMMHGIH